MAQLPADRTKLALAQGNQVPSAVASSTKNINAIAELYDTVDLLNQKVNTHASSPTLPHADNSVTTAKIADLNVTTGKIAPLAITTGKIALAAVGVAQLSPGAQVNESVNNALITALMADFVSLKAKGADPTGVTDITALFQSVVDDDLEEYQTLYIPHGRYKLANRVVVNKPINLICDGVFEVYEDGGIDFEVAPNNPTTIFATVAGVKVDGLKFLYKDTYISSARIPLHFKIFAYNLQINGLMVTSREIINGVEITYGRSYAGLFLEKCFNVTISNSVIDRAVYGGLLSSVLTNYGNTTFDNVFVNNTYFGFANTSNDGLQDSINFRNVTVNHFYMGDPYNFGHIKTAVATNAAQGDMIVSVSDGSLFAGLTTPFAMFFSNGASTIVNSIDGNDLILLYPLTYSVTTAQKAIAGSVSILVDGQWRNFNITDGCHFEEATYPIAVCGWGSSGIIEGNLFSKNTNPIYLFQSENIVIGINAYEKRTGDYYFVRLGDTSFFREVIIYAPTKGYFDPADTLDANFIYIKDNASMAFTPMLVYNQTFVNQKIGGKRNPVLIKDQSTGLEFDISLMANRSAKFTKSNSAFWYVDLDNNQEVSSVHTDAITESGTTVKIIRKRGFTAAPTTGTWRRGDIVWNDAPSAGGYTGWICVTAGVPGTWKGYGLIEA